MSTATVITTRATTATSTTATTLKLPPRASRAGTIARALAVALVPLGALAALGGAYSWSVLPLLFAAAAAFLISGGIIAAPGMRTLDAWLIALVAAVAIQLVPLPGALTLLVSPHARDLQLMLSLDSGNQWRPLTIDPRLTREGLETLAAAILVFWAARAIFSRGGLRTLLRAFAIGGFLVAIGSVAQRVTSPNLIFMWWGLTPGPTAQPFGPFANRNHFAAWLLMATAMTAGYTIAHLHSHVHHSSSRRRLVRDLLVDGTGLLLAGSAVATALTIFATSSRGGILGFCSAGLVGVTLSRTKTSNRGRAHLAMAVLVAITAWGAWLNYDALSQRLVPGGPAGRLTIWRETLPIIHDFPATGTGVGTYHQSMLRYQRTERRVLFNQAHSEYMQLAAEGGLLVGIPVLGIVVTWLALARRRLRQETQGLFWVRVGAAAGIAGVAVHAIWECPIRLTANAMLLAVLAAIVVHERASRPAVNHSD